MINDKYQCVQYNEYGFEFGKTYTVDRESEIYLPNSESLEMIDVVVFEKDQWIPYYDFDRIFKKVDLIRNEKIDWNSN